MNTGNGLNSEDTNFGGLTRGKTDALVPDAWGGYMDAGDWDRRIQHLAVSLYLLELAELFPDYFSRVSLNLPESNDGLPDIVSEALFTLDCYRRMQTPEAASAAASNPPSTRARANARGRSHSTFWHTRRASGRATGMPPRLLGPRVGWRPGSPSKPRRTARVRFGRRIGPSLSCLSLGASSRMKAASAISGTWPPRSCTD